MIDLALLIDKNTAPLLPHPSKRPFSLSKVVCKRCRSVLLKQLQGNAFHVKDTTFLNNGVVMNKKARYNLCIGDISQSLTLRMVWELSLKLHTIHTQTRFGRKWKADGIGHSVCCRH